MSNRVHAYWERVCGVKLGLCGIGNGLWLSHFTSPGLQNRSVCSVLNLPWCWERRRVSSYNTCSTCRASWKCSAVQTNVISTRGLNNVFIYWPLNRRSIRCCLVKTAVEKLSQNTMDESKEMFPGSRKYINKTTLVSTSTLHYICCI